MLRAWNGVLLPAAAVLWCLAHSSLLLGPLRSQDRGPKLTPEPDPKEECASASFTKRTVLNETFENGAVLKPPRGTEIVAGAGNDGSGLRAVYKPTSRGSGRLTDRIPFQKSSTARLEFDVIFEDGWEFVKGGKLHGLGGGTTTSGCEPPSKDGWSARFMWRSQGELVVYVYDQDRKERCGDDYSTGFYLPTKRFVHLSMHIKTNSNPNLADGRIEVLVDGHHCKSISGLRLTGRKDIAIDTFMFSTFFGGADRSWAPSKPVSAVFDNFLISVDD